MRDGTAVSALRAEKAKGMFHVEHSFGETPALAPLGQGSGGAPCTRSYSCFARGILMW